MPPALPGANPAGRARWRSRPGIRRAASAAPSRSSGPSHGWRDSSGSSPCATRLAAWTSKPAPSTSARSPIPPPAPSSCRSTRPPRTRRRRWGSSRYDYARTAQPDPRRAAGVPGLARERPPRARVRVGHGGDDDDRCTCSIPGERVVSVNDVYGGTYRLFSKVYEPKGYRFTYVTRRAVQHRACRRTWATTRALVWLESPTNPLLNVIDLRRRPTQHTRPARSSWSTTRSPRRTCSGRSSTAPTSSCIRRRSTWAATPTSWAGSRRRTTTASPSGSGFLQNSLGAVPGPFDAWLVLRGLKTLGVRMRAHCENAARVVAFLAGRRGGRAGALPGPAHPTRATRSPAGRCDGFGGMISFLAGRERRGRGAGRADEDLDARREPGRRREPDRAPRPR